MRKHAHKVMLLPHENIIKLYALKDFLLQKLCPDGCQDSYSQCYPGLYLRRRLLLPVLLSFQIKRGLFFNIPLYRRVKKSHLEHFAILLFYILSRYVLFAACRLSQVCLFVHMDALSRSGCTRHALFSASRQRTSGNIEMSSEDVSDWSGEGGRRGYRISLPQESPGIPITYI